MKRVKRIFIESDILHKEALAAAEMHAADYIEASGLRVPKNIFDQTLDFAWHDLEKTWEAVKSADEIYADSSLMPLVGNNYMGAPVIFNGMCERAIKENVTGKSVIIFNSLSNIYWGMIDIPLMKKAFKENKLLMFDENYDKIIHIDVSKVRKK